MRGPLLAAATALLAFGAGESGQQQQRRSHVVSRPLGARPFGVAVSPRTGVAYVGQLDAAQLTRADLRAARLGAAVAVGTGPVAIAFSPDGATAYVANQLSHTLGFVDVATNTQFATAAVGARPFSVAASPDGAAVYVGTDRGYVAVVDARTRRVVRRIVLGGAVNAIVMHPVLSVLYASSFTTGQVWEISARSHEMLRTFTTGGAPQGLALSPDGCELYIANESGPLLIWHLTVDRPADTVAAVARGFGVGITPDALRLYVTVPSEGRLYVLGRLSRQVREVVQLGGIPRRVDFDSAGTTAVVANEAGAVQFVSR